MKFDVSLSQPHYRFSYFKKCTAHSIKMSPGIPFDLFLQTSISMIDNHPHKNLSAKQTKHHRKKCKNKSERPFATLVIYYFVVVHIFYLFCVDR